MSLTAAAAAAARRASQQLCCQRTHVLADAVLGSRAYSTSAATLVLPSSRLAAFLQQESPAIQQLISLRQSFSSSAHHASSIPGGVPGTGGGSAERQTGGDVTPSGSAEGSSGTATLPGGRGAEANVGLGDPGQTAPVEAGTGLRDPTDSAPTEQQAGSSDSREAAAAERIGPPGSTEPDAQQASQGSQPDPAAAAADGTANRTGDQPQAEAATATIPPQQQPAGGPDGNSGHEPTRAEQHDAGGVIHFLIDYYAQRLASLSANALKKAIEGDFDENQFLESAKDAYWIVNKLFHERDFDTLKPMVSSSLLKAFRDTHEDFEKKSMSFSLKSHDVDSATIYGVYSLTKDDIAARDAEEAEKLKDSPTQGLVISVKFRGQQEIEIKDAAGKVTSHLTDKRSHIWRFARGPLPSDLPVRQLADLDWRVLEVMS